MAAHGGDAKAITDVSLDLGAAYQAGTREHCPNAKISFDPFHVVALANDALDQALRAVFARNQNPADAGAGIDAWISWARRSRLAPFKRLGATIKKYREGILEHFRSGLSNGFAEGLNGRI